MSTLQLNYGQSSLRSLPWKRVSEDALVSPEIDINWLIAQPLLPFLVQVMPPHVLYRSLLKHGFEDALEVVEWIRGKPLQKILDFDIWQESAELGVEDVSARRCLNWIALWLEIGPEFAAERFVELDEETIVLTLSQIFEIVPDGVGFVSDEMRENWWKTTDNRFFLRIREESEDSIALLKSFIDALYIHDAKLAASLLAYSAMLVRQESLEEGLHWRSNRLAEQGFVSREEALKTLSAKKLSNIKKALEEAKKAESARREVSHSFSSFEESEWEGLVHFLATLPPEEGTAHLECALGVDNLRQICGGHNVNIADFYEDEDFIHESCEKILKKANALLTTAWGGGSRASAPRLLIEKTLVFLAEQDSENVYRLKQSIASLANTMACAHMRGSDVESTEQAFFVVRGALNVGLEWCLSLPEEYELALSFGNEIENAAACIERLGCEFIFQMGWNALLSQVEALSKRLQEQQNLSSSKMSVLRPWLSQSESVLSAQTFVVLDALFAGIPLFPVALDVKAESPLVVPRDVRPFETLNDIECIARFTANLEHHVGK